MFVVQLSMVVVMSLIQPAVWEASFHEASTAAHFLPAEGPITLLCTQLHCTKVPKVILPHGALWERLGSLCLIAWFS